MFDGQIVNSSPTHVFTAAADLTGNAFTAVSLTENGVITAGASSIPIGILTAEHEDIKAGDDCTVQLRGGSLWLAGENISAGDFLSSDDNGLAVKSTAGKFIFAQALANAAKDSAVECQIICAGYLA